MLCRSIIVLFVLAQSLALMAVPASASPLRQQYRVSANAMTQDYPASITFQLKLADARDVSGIGLRFGTNGQSCAKVSARSSIEFKPGASVDAEWEWDLKNAGTLPPGVEVWWEWEITDSAGRTTLIAQQRELISDSRHTWRDYAADDVVIHWAKGNDKLAREIHAITVSGLKSAARDYGISIDRAAHIWVYPDFQALRDSMHFEAEWVGGVALSQHNSVLTAIGTGSQQMNWAREVLPHEVTHLVVGARMFNCRGAGLPTWLNEGLATYSEPNRRDIAAMRKAVESKRILSLRSLSGAFAADGALSGLQYAMSGDVVGYMVQQRGPKGMSDLLNRVREGARIDDALQAVYGVDTDGLDAAWRRATGIKTLPVAQPTPTPTPAGNRPRRTPAPTFAPIDPRATPEP